MVRNSEPIIRGRFNTNRAHRVRYTCWAPVYDSVVGIFTPKRRRAIELAGPRPGEEVLLLGAGTGLDLELLPPGLDITAIDLTPAMLERLKRRARRLGLNVQALIMDGQVLTFPDEAFDVVLLHLIVAVIPDPVRCLKETQRVLRPGGRAVIFDKFVPDERRPSLWLRLLQPVASFLGSEFTRKLGPILAETALSMISNEPAGFRGLFRIVLLRKGAKSSPSQES